MQNAKTFCSESIIAEFNSTESGQFTIKNYFLSHRVAYNGDDSVLACLSAGMRLATIESKAEKDNLIAIAKKNPKLFENDIFIDGVNLIEDQKKDSCFTFRKPSKQKTIIQQLHCDVVINKFLCESTEIVDEYEDDASLNETETIIDVKAKFYSHFGDYGEH